jgi:hypothetical protein
MPLSLSPGLPDLDPSRVGPALVVADWAEPKVAWYYMVMRTDDFVTEFRVCNATGPQRVESRAPDGSVQPWDCRTEGDELVYYAPDGYTGGPVGWFYDKRLQKGVRMSGEDLEKRATRMRVSAAMGV